VGNGIGDDAPVDGHDSWHLRQVAHPHEVSAGLRGQLIDCWVTVSNAGGAVGFPFPPVDTTTVAPAADRLIAGLNPGRSRLLIARTGDALAGWAHLHRDSYPLIAHWGTISHLQTLPACRGQGIGGALMAHARHVARTEMGLEQLRLAARGGTGLEHFYGQLGWRLEADLRSDNGFLVVKFTPPRSGSSI
jgi:GNAT superfamily N-acetyltransferase